MSLFFSPFLPLAEASFLLASSLGRCETCCSQQTLQQEQGLLPAGVEFLSHLHPLLPPCSTAPSSGPLCHLKPSYQFFLLPTPSRVLECSRLALQREGSGCNQCSKFTIAVCLGTEGCLVGREDSFAFFWEISEGKVLYSLLLFLVC